VRQFVQIDLHGDPKPNDAAKEKAKADALSAEAAAATSKTFFIIQPGNATKTKWDLALGMVVLYSIMIVPLRIGFGLEVRKLAPRSSECPPRSDVGALYTARPVRPSSFTRTHHFKTHHLQPRDEWQLKPCSTDDIIDIAMDGLFFFDMFLCCNEAFTVDGPDGAATL
jgi:hypothetical protein